MYLFTCWMGVLSMKDGVVGVGICRYSVNFCFPPGWDEPTMQGTQLG